MKSSTTSGVLHNLSLDPPKASLDQNAQVHGVSDLIHTTIRKEARDQWIVIMGFFISMFVLVYSFTFLTETRRKHRRQSALEVPENVPKIKEVTVSAEVEPCSYSTQTQHANFGNNGF